MRTTRLGFQETIPQREVDLSCVRSENKQQKNDETVVTYIMDVRFFSPR